MMAEMPDSPRVPVRSKALLEEWVAEFFAQPSRAQPGVKVAIQDGSDGRDTGLVIFRLTNVPADVYMEPVGFDDHRWVATLATRISDLTLTPYAMTTLATEVALAAALCDFLQFKSLEWDRMSGMR